jgi:hypothetical protein
MFHCRVGGFVVDVHRAFPPHNRDRHIFRMVMSELDRLDIKES